MRRLYSQHVSCASWQGQTLFSHVNTSDFDLCFGVGHCIEFSSCRTQTSLHQSSSKAPTATLPEVLLKVLSSPLPNPLGVQRALGCYRVLVAVTPVPQRAAFSGSITLGQSLVSLWHVRGSHQQYDLQQHYNFSVLHDVYVAVTPLPEQAAPQSNVCHYFKACQCCCAH